MNKIRCSMLSGYTDCPRRGAAKQFRELIQDAGYALRELPASIGASIGTSCHLGAVALTDAAITGQEKPVELAVEMSIEECRTLIADGVLWDATTPQLNDADKQIKTLVTAFNRDGLPSITDTIYTEHSRNAITGTLSITGHTDIESADAITDLKFASVKRNYLEQLGGYSVIRKAEEKTPTKSLRIIHIPRVPVRKPFPGISVYNYDVKIAEMAAFYTIKMIENQLNNFIKTSNPWSFPANCMSMMCSDKYCPAWGTKFCERGC